MLASANFDSNGGTGVPLQDKFSARKFGVAMGKFIEYENVAIINEYGRGEGEGEVG